MWKKVVVVLSLLAVGAGTLVAMQQEEDKIQETTTPFMQRKLDASRDIVSGLATENFDLIRRSAQDLMLLSHEADWNVLTTPDYLRMSSEFRSSVERMRDSANSKNLDGSTLAYFEVTLSCVRCHKYIRQNAKEEK